MTLVHTASEAVMGFCFLFVFALFCFAPALSEVAVDGSWGHDGAYIVGPEGTESLKSPPETLSGLLQVKP